MGKDFHFLGAGVMALTRIKTPSVLSMDELVTFQLFIHQKRKVKLR